MFVSGVDDFLGSGADLFEIANTTTLTNLYANGGRDTVRVTGTGAGTVTNVRTGADDDTKDQVDGSKEFDGGEGCYYAGGTCWFTTKGDNRVWAYNAGSSSIDLTYDDSLVVGGPAPLTGVDNVTRSSGGDLFVAEDGGNLEICIITPNGIVAPFLRVTGQNSSEITGPAFSPNGQRLYFSSQRGTSGSSSGGITYEVSGPFRT